MRLFKRHIKSTIALIIYAIWWSFFFNWFDSGKSDYPASCGAANGALVMLSLLIGGTVSLIFSILILSNSGQKRIDYLIFLGLALSPIVFIIGHMYYGYY